MTQANDMDYPTQANPNALLKELQTARAQLAKAKKRRARRKLDQYRAAILLLRAHDATFGEIQKVLARHRIQVSPMTIRNSVRRWEQEEMERAHSASNS